jgi:sigma-B regulation protein RsbU (phosphoserine phosphatase)
MHQGEAMLPAADALYDEAACGLVLTTPDGTIRRANATFCRWTGFAAADLVGRRRVQDLLTMGGRIFHQTHWAPLLQIQGSVAEVKLDVIHRDGHPIPMVLNAVRRVHPSGVFHELAMLVAEDRHQYERELLLARRQAEMLLAQERAAQQALTLAEARLRLALESAQLFVWDVEPATGERNYEDDVALLLGHAATRRIGHDEYADRIDPADREREALAFAQAIDSTRPGYRCIYRLRCVDGQIRTVRSTAQAVFDAKGVLLRFVGVLQDISEVVRQQAAAEDRAVFAEQMMGIVSHDLRNPLSAIKMSILLLERADLAPKHRLALGRIEKSTNRANRLIGDLLDFTSARIGSGLSVKKAPVHLHAVVAEAVGELRAAFDARVLIHRTEGEGLGNADADRLTQALGNLVANAMTYGAADGEVVVTSIVRESDFSLHVHNDGEPLAADSLALLFDPMTRGAAADQSYRSVGLGLYIVREIARSHGGDVTAMSRPGEGTTFIVTLPRL